MFIAALFVEMGNWSVSTGRIERQNVIDVHPGVQPSEKWIVSGQNNMGTS